MWSKLQVADTCCVRQSASYQRVHARLCMLSLILLPAAITTVVYCFNFALRVLNNTPDTTTRAGIISIFSSNILVPSLCIKCADMSFYAFR